MEPTALYNEAVAQATAVIKQVRDDQLASPTPDTEWTVRELANHMLYELSWVADIVQGKTIKEVSDAYDGDLFTDSTDLAVQWDLAAERADLAIREASMEDTAHLSFADMTVGDYLRMEGGDQLIHSWDLGEALGITVTFDADVAREVYDGMKQADLQSTGLFAAAVEVPDDAPLQTKLLALTGRSHDWRSQL